MGEKVDGKRRDTETRGYQTCGAFCPATAALVRPAARVAQRVALPIPPPLGGVGETVSCPCQISKKFLIAHITDENRISSSGLGHLLQTFKTRTTGIDNRIT